MNKSLLKDMALLGLLSALVYMVNLWGYPLFDVDEPRYAETAREMLTTPGDWITPHFNWMTRFDKPVLFYWLIAGVYQVLGIAAGSARLVSALAATATVFMVYVTGRVWINRKAGLLSAIVFLTMLEPYILGRWSVTDMTLSTFMCATWLALFAALTRVPHWYIAAGIAAGLGMLTKGPVAIVLPGTTLVLYTLIFQREQWKRLFSPWLFAGLILFAAVAMPWYYLVAQANPEEFVGSFFFLHNVERFTSTVSGHSGPWYYYVPVLLIGCFPWVFWLPSAAKALSQTFRSLPPVVHYSLIWTGLVFVFFSAAGTKLLTYILPLFPALALLLGYWLSQLLQSPQFFWVRLRLGAIVMSVLCGAGLLVTLFKPTLGVPAALLGVYQPCTVQCLLSLLTLTALGIIWFARKQQAPALIRVWTLGLVLSWLLVNGFGLPMAAEMVQGDTITFAKRAVRDHVPMATYRMKKPSLVFYTQAKVYFMPALDDPDYPPPTRNNFDSDLHVQMPLLYLVVKNKDICSLKNRLHFDRLETGRVYSLLKLKNVTLRKDLNV